MKKRKVVNKLFRKYNVYLYNEYNEILRKPKGNQIMYESMIIEYEYEIQGTS